MGLGSSGGWGLKGGWGALVANGWSLVGPDTRGLGFGAVWGC